MKQRIKSVLPSWVVFAARTLRVRLERRRYRDMTVRETFETIYQEHRWGGEKSFCSGSGSEGDAAQEYVAFIKRFIQTKDLHTIVDLGCGDFRVGRALVEGIDVRYIGVDIVEAL